MLQSFFRQVPDEIIEAAKIDGAGPWRIFFTIVLPLSTPGPGHGGDPGRCVDLERIADRVDPPQLRRTARPIPVGLLNFQGQFANNNTGLAAGILIAVVPILIAYILLQRWIVGGLTAGATKG